MADFEVRISDLPGANPLGGIELTPVVQDGQTKTRAAQDFVREAGLGQHEAAADPHSQYAFRVKNNLTATRDPDVNDDASQGYEPTSRWVNTVTNEFFICVVDTVGSANWQQQTLTLDELGSAALVDTGAGNGLDADLLDGQHGSYYQAWANVTGKPSPLITVNGDATGSVTLTDLTDGTLTLTVVDDSHNHIISNVDGLQTALDTKVESVNGKTTKDITLVTDDISEDASPTNLWYTDTRARNAISVSGDLTYDSLNGIISYNETYSTPSELLTAIKTVDGSTSGLDADLLDGQDSSYYQNASNLNSGTISDARLPATISSDTTGNAATATKLATARTIALGGDLSGSANFDGSGNITITGVVADDSHNHIISNIDGLQAALDSKDNYGGWTLYTDGVSRGTVTSSEIVNLVGGSNVSLSYSATNNTITINSVDTNTTYSAGTGLTLSGTTFSLTDESYTLTEKNKLAGIEAGAEVNDPTNLGQSRNGTSYTITSSTGTNTTLAAATTTVAGVLTASDKTKLDGIEAGAEVNTVDSVDGQTGAVTLNYDNYGGWALQTDGVSRGTITSGEAVNLVGGSNITIGYSATNNTITLAAESGADTNWYLDGLTFNTTDGILTASVNGTTNQTVDLDGRYLLQGAKAADSELLDGIDSTQFLRSDQDDTMTGTLSIQNTANPASLILNRTDGQEFRFTVGTSGGAMKFSDTGEFGIGPVADVFTDTNLETAFRVFGSGDVSMASDVSVGGILSGNGSGLTGTAANLRAQATTKTDVGLSGIPNTNGSTVNYLRGDGSWVTPPYDNYGSWTLLTDGVSRGGISSGENVNFVGGSNVSLSYSATNNTITVNSTDTNTTYTAGTGLSLSGTQFNVDNPFDPAGTYLNLRAQATTQGDVGLGNVRNVASYSQTESDGRFAQLSGGADANFTTMPQVGGASIISSGSNSDGYWTDFSDGTSILSTIRRNITVNSSPGGNIITSYYPYPKTVNFFRGASISYWGEDGGSPRGGCYGADMETSQFRIITRNDSGSFISSFRDVVTVIYGNA